MYTPKHFLQNDVERCFALIEQNPLALIITQDNGEIDANSIPLILSQKSSNPVLQGHVAKANPIWKTLESTQSALIVFQGVDHYISPNFYATKKANPKVVPTWNYSTVHIKASVNVHHDVQWKRAMLETLTNKHESTQPKPWSVDDAPSDYIDKQMAGIVGIELIATNMLGKWKVSQNQPRENQTSVIAALPKTEQGLHMANEIDSHKKGD